MSKFFSDTTSDQGVEKDRLNTAQESYKLALLHLDNGENLKALPLAKKALSIDGSNSNYISAMAQSMMPGKGYKYLLRKIHETCKPATYLEIGVSKGRSMSIAGKSTSAVGIDPAFQIDSKIEAQARLFPITSDDFFERYNLFSELNSKRLDLVFIDGLHIFEQVYNDFLNAERYANKNTVVLIHDCYPVSDLTASRKRDTNFWTGDVWKIIPCLLNERPDLTVNVVPCPPSGLAVISGFNSSDQKCDRDVRGISEKYRDIEFRSIPEDRKQYFNTVENSWDTIKDLLYEYSTD